MIAALVIIGGFVFVKLFAHFNLLNIENAIAAEIDLREEGTMLSSLLSSRTSEMGYMEILGDMFIENHESHIISEKNRVKDTLDRMDDDYYFALYSGELGGEPSEYDPMILEAGAEFSVPASVIKAVMKRESGFKPDVISRCGAAGLMQLMPGTALQSSYITKTYNGWTYFTCKEDLANELKGFAIGKEPEKLEEEDERFNPRKSIMAGTEYLEKLWVLFNGSLELVFASYNAGENAISKAIDRCRTDTGEECDTWSDIKDYTPQSPGSRAETAKYVLEVAKNYFDYSEITPASMELAWCEPPGEVCRLPVTAGMLRAEVPIPGARPGNLKGMVVLA